MALFKSIRSKFLTGILCLLVIVFGIQIFLSVSTTKIRLIEEVNREVEIFAQLTVRPLVSTYNSYYVSGFHKFKEIVEAIKKSNPFIINIYLVDMEGRIRFDTDDLTLKEFGQLQSIDLALLERARRSSIAYTFQDEKNKIYYQIISPFIDEWGRHEYSLIYTVSYESALREVNRTILRNILLATITLLLSFIFVSLIAFNITRPLLKLEEGVRVVGKGDLDYKFQIKTNDELEQVAEEFNKMTQKLKESYQKLEESKFLLETKVEERTGELKSKVEELEKFHKVAVGRELKMVELKEEIKRLNEELEKFKGQNKNNSILKK